ncbi:hypothetical protein F2Q70_00008751 [Brassica cretica]|uniref:Small ribosomal subunit protein uS5 C-terminal domain-containing protein n=1 Tax=Brassica cretica TaxID=69181 RepID=A0A8S9LWG7_BRACR|nr:hypothetical protein F2Q70_00008751 [Brassica cretica]
MEDEIEYMRIGCDKLARADKATSERLGSLENQIATMGSESAVRLGALEMSSSSLFVLRDVPLEAALLVPALSKPNTHNKNDHKKEKEKWKRGNKHFLTDSISAPDRRAALTVFSSRLAAELGALFRITTGSQSCVIGPTPAMISSSSSLTKSRVSSPANIRTIGFVKGIISSVQSAYLCFSLLSSSPVRRGYWGNKIGKPHTVPCKVTGKCGSVTVRMVPAPRGAGVVAARVPKMVLQFAGIDDVFTSSRGSTKTLGNFVKFVPVYIISLGLMDDQREIEAVEELSKAIAFRPELQTLHLREEFHEATGKLSLAAQDCEAGLCLDPNHTETLHLYSRSERVLNLGLTSLMEHRWAGQALFGTEAAKWICVSAIDVTQLSVAGM